MKNYLWVRGIQLSDFVKGKKEVVLFDLCKKAAVTKQIKLASSAKDRRKLLEEKLRTSEDKFSIPKILNA